MDLIRTAALMTASTWLRIRGGNAPVHLAPLAEGAGPHVLRLAEHADAIRVQAMQFPNQALEAALCELSEALKNVSFELLKPRSFWSGIVRRGPEKIVGFATQYARVNLAAKALNAAIHALHEFHLRTTGEASKLLLEFEIEYRA